MTISVKGLNSVKGVNTRGNKCAGSLTPPPPWYKGVNSVKGVNHVFHSWIMMEEMVSLPDVKGVKGVNTIDVCIWAASPAHPPWRKRCKYVVD